MARTYIPIPRAGVPPLPLREDPARARDLARRFLARIRSGEIHGCSLPGVEPLAQLDDLLHPRPADEWHEDDGPALWWSPEAPEAPWVGTPLDSDWPDYHTHWTPLPVPDFSALRRPPLAREVGVGEEVGGG